MHTAGVDMDFVADAKRLFGRHMPEYMVRVVLHRFLLQKANCPSSGASRSIRKFR